MKEKVPVKKCLVRREPLRLQPLDESVVVVVAVVCLLEFVSCTLRYDSVEEVRIWVMAHDYDTPMSPGNRLFVQ